MCPSDNQSYDVYGTRLSDLGMSGYQGGKIGTFLRPAATSPPPLYADFLSVTTAVISVLSTWSSARDQRSPRVGDDSLPSGTRISKKVSIRWALPPSSDSEGGRYGGNIDAVVVFVNPSSHRNEDLKYSSSSFYSLISLPSLCRWVNRKGITRWLHGEIISRDTRETFLQKHTTTWNGAASA